MGTDSSESTPRYGPLGDEEDECGFDSGIEGPVSLVNGTFIEVPVQNTAEEAIASSRRSKSKVNSSGPNAATPGAAERRLGCPLPSRLHALLVLSHIRRLLQWPGMPFLPHLQAGRDEEAQEEAVRVPADAGPPGREAAESGVPGGGAAGRGDHSLPVRSHG